MKHFLTNSLMFAVATLSGQSLDPTFGEGGKTSSVSNYYLDYIPEATKIAPDGSIYTYGTNYVPRLGDYDIILRKFTKDGRIDLSFADQGVFTINLFEPIHAGGIYIESDGSLVISGHVSNLGAHPFMFRMDAQGKLSTGGYVTFSNAPLSMSITAMTKLGNDYLLAGRAAGDFYVIKVDQDGNTVPSFGNGGVASVDFDGGIDYVEDILISDAGDIILGGHSKKGTDKEKFAAAAFDGNTGALKPSFGNQGKLLTQVSLTGEDLAFTLNKLPNGKLLLSGYSFLPNRRVLALASFDAQTGTLDRNFDFDGKRVIYLAGKSDWCTDATVHNGQIYLTGISQQYNNDYKPVIVKILPDGSNDYSFGSLGAIVIDEIGYMYSYLSFQNDKPVLYSRNATGGYLLMRLNPLPVPSASRIASVATDMESAGMYVYPNPAVDRVTCTFAQELLEGDGLASLELVDVYGHTVVQNVPMEGNSVELSVAQLEAGVYSAKVTTSDGKLLGVSKFVVQP